MLKALGLKALPSLPEIPFLLSRTRGLYRFQERNLPKGPLVRGKMSLACQFSECTQTSPSNLNYYTKKLLHSLSGNSGRKTRKKNNLKRFTMSNFCGPLLGPLLAPILCFLLARSFVDFYTFCCLEVYTSRWHFSQNP